MVETANATVGCVEHSLLPSSGDVFSTFRVTGWSAKALSVVRIRLFEKFVNSAIQNYGPIMVHEPVPTTTKHAFGSHPRRVFSISYLLTGFFHGGGSPARRAAECAMRFEPKCANTGMVIAVIQPAEVRQLLISRPELARAFPAQVLRVQFCSRIS